MYRNYDGARSVFGNTSVSATVPNPDNVSAFAALGRAMSLTVMVIGKYLSGSTPATLKLAHFTAGTAAHVWQLTSSNAIQHLPDLPISNGTITAQLPQQSITLFVIPGSPRSCDLNTDGSVNVADAQISVNQALGILACTTADLQQMDTATFVDVQRIANAALGRSCVIGP